MQNTTSRPPNPLPEIRVHLGAHKTATTHLQRTIEASLQNNPDFGGSYIPNHRIRPALGGDLYTGNGYRIVKRFPFMRPFLIKKDAIRRIRNLTFKECKPDGPVIFSEENIMGSSDTIFTGHLYPTPWKLHVLPYLDPGATLKLYLSIRSLDTFLPSAYSEALKQKKYARSDFRHAVNLFIKNNYHWHAVVKTIFSVAPKATLEIWDYDDYEFSWEKMHRSFLGDPHFSLDVLPKPDRTRSPGEAGIVAAENMDVETGKNRADAVRDIYRTHIASGHDKTFDPLTDAEKATFKEKFAQDLRRIDKDFPNTLRTSW